VVFGRRLGGSGGGGSGSGLPQKHFILEIAAQIEKAASAKRICAEQQKHLQAFTRTPRTSAGGGGGGIRHLDICSGRGGRGWGRKELSGNGGDNA